MTDFEKEEFFKALDRQYEAAVELRIACEQLAVAAKQDDRRITKLENPEEHES
jgi:hypothetical protein